MALAHAVRQMRCIGAIIIAVAALAGCTVPSPQQLAEKNRILTSPPPPAEARIWIFRNFDPSITQNTPYILINGRIVGVAWLGSAFYRDVPPGNYVITVESRGSAPNQFAHIGLAAGQLVYVKVDPNSWWAGLCWRCQIDTYFTLVQSPQLALAQLASIPIGTGG
jgi:hypothetical protein